MKELDDKPQMTSCPCCCINVTLNTGILWHVTRLQRCVTSIIHTFATVCTDISSNPAKNNMLENKQTSFDMTNYKVLPGVDMNFNAFLLISGVPVHTTYIRLVLL